MLLLSITTHWFKTFQMTKYQEMITSSQTKTKVKIPHHRNSFQCSKRL